VTFKETLIGWEEGAGNFTFSGCTSLTNVVFPQKLFSIGDGTFNGATGIQTLKMHTDIWASISATLCASSVQQVVTFYDDSYTYKIRRDSAGKIEKLLTFSEEQRRQRDQEIMDAQNQFPYFTFNVDDPIITSL
jgi:hypothetical protein